MIVGGSGAIIMNHAILASDSNARGNCSERLIVLEVLGDLGACPCMIEFMNMKTLFCDRWRSIGLAGWEDDVALTFCSEVHRGQPVLRLPTAGVTLDRMSVAFTLN